MKRVLIAMTVAALGSVLLPTAASAVAVCTPTGFYRDGINLTAAQMGGNVTAPLDATGCNIGVYYGPGTSGNVTGADIFGANYFGVVARGASVNVTNSTVHDIGDVPLNGSQHGLAIYFATVDTGTATTPPTCTSGATTGTISGNSVAKYQKGGIISNCTGTAVTVRNNTVTGEGPVPYIAQNGIQVGYGAKATVTGNTVTGNAYTGPTGASSAGVLVVGGPCFALPYTVGLSITKNTLTGNDVGVWLFNANATCDAPPVKTNNSVKQNKISNDLVTNTTGYDSSVLTPCGYQAGVADVGHRDLIVNNTVSGLGYTPQLPDDCEGAPPAFLRFIDLDSSARGVPSNK
jgi:Right handed beta helix region